MCIKIIFHILTIFRNSMKMNARGVTSTVFVCNILFPKMLKSCEAKKPEINIVVCTH